MTSTISGRIYKRTRRQAEEDHFWREQAMKNAGYVRVEDHRLLGIIEELGTFPPVIATTKLERNWPSLDHEYWAKAEDARAAFVLQETTNGRAAERHPWRRSRLDAFEFVKQPDTMVPLISSVRMECR